MRWIWFILGLLSLGLGLLGALLPLLPTVPLLLLATFFFARSSERLHDWLITHPTLGPPIQDWQSTGSISRTGKKLATLSIVAAFALSLILGVKPWVLGVQAVVLSLVMLFIWTRPEA